jgi:hypothetical protein
MERRDPETTIREKYAQMKAVLTERTRRGWAATEVQVLGHGGQSLVARATGLSLSARQGGKRELAHGLTRAEARGAASRLRRAGGGRRRLTEKEPEVGHVLEALVEPRARGDPCVNLRGRCKSTRHLAHAWGVRGDQISQDKVVELLAELGGPSKNGGREWQRHPQPPRVQGHDVPDPARGKAIPYGGSAQYCSAHSLLGGAVRCRRSIGMSTSVVLAHPLR